MAGDEIKDSKDTEKNARLERFNMFEIAKSLGFDIDLGRVLSNEVTQVYKDFEEWLSEYYDEELEKIEKSLIEQVENAKTKKHTLNVTHKYAYIDQDFEHIVSNVLLVNFNDLLYLTKRIILDLELSSIQIIESKYEVTQNNLDSFNVIIAGLYKAIKIKAAKLGKELFIYIPDLTSWLIGTGSGVFIYSIVSETMLNCNVLFHELERNSLYERIAGNQGKKIQRLYSLDFDNLETSLVLGCMVIIKNEFQLESVYEWFEPLTKNAKALKEGVIKNINSQKDKDILNPTVWKMLVREYKDWLNKRNTNPEELYNMKSDLAKYKAYNQLFNEEAFGIEIEKLETDIKEYICAKYEVGPESFFEYLNTAKFEINVSNIAKDKIQIEKTIKNFDRIFRERVLGQDQVIKPLWSILKKWYIGVRNEKPVGSFLFCGPTGVGKTETAKLLADSTFGSLITLDMSEYQTEIDATKIIGVAPGYAGYDQGAGILDKIAANPRSIILFDEIEKAHYKIFDLLLQVLDEGRLTDHKGNIVSFKECFILCTTNAHYSEIEHLGDNARSKMIEILGGTFRKEFLARFNDVIKYNPLSNETMEKIFDLKIEKEIKEISDSTRMEITIIEDENYFKVKSDIIHFMDNSLGARELQRIIFKEIISGMIDTISELEYQEKIVFYFDTEGKLKVHDGEL